MCTLVIDFMYELNNNLTFIIFIKKMLFNEIVIKGVLHPKFFFHIYKLIYK